MRTLFALAAAMMSAPAMQIFAQSNGQIAEAIWPTDKRRRQKAGRMLAAANPRYRNRWKAGRPKKHRNMNHVSRRTRRKHRRRKSA